MGVSTVAGLPSDDFLAECRRPLLLVLDDLMLSTSEEYITSLFTRRSHHESISVVFVVQNLFEKKIRVARSNSQYIILTRSPNAILSVRNLGNQLFPLQMQYFMDSYTQATRQLYGYMLIDMHPASDPLLRLRTHIFPDESVPQTLFIPRNV
jgi:hypothetical protein